MFRSWLVFGGIFHQRAEVRSPINLIGGLASPLWLSLKDHGFFFCRKIRALGVSWNIYFLLEREARDISLNSIVEQKLREE